MKFNPALIFVLIVLLALAAKFGSTPQAIADLTAWKTTQYDFYYVERNSGWPIPAYKFGDATIRASGPSYNCSDTGRLLVPRPDSACYSYSLSSDALGTSPKFTASKIIEYSPYIKVDGSLTGAYDTEDSSRPDWKETFKFYYSPVSIVAHGIDQEFNQVLGKKKVRILIENNLGAEFEGGISLIRTDAQFFKQTSKQFPLTIKKGNNIYDVEIDFNELGHTKLSIQPYIKVYNFALGFTKEDTGYCFNFCKSGTCPNQCVQKSLLAFPSTVNYKFQTFPNGTDLDKDVTTDCTTSMQCPSKFSCVSNICELNTRLLKPSVSSPGTTIVVDVEEPVALAESFVGPFNPEIGLAAVSIIVILIFVWVAVKWQ